MRSLLIVCTLAVVGTSLAADIPPGPNAEVWMIQPGHVWVAPDGSGPSLAAAHDGFGGPADATIHIILRTHSDNPIVSYPAEDVWLEGETADFAACIGGTSASADTDDQGYTTIVGPLRAGGQIPPGSQPSVRVGGEVVLGADLPLTVNSPDVNGDLVVNLSDVAAMAGSLGTDDWRCDFNADGVVNLVDISVFTPLIGAACP